MAFQLRDNPVNFLGAKQRCMQTFTSQLVSNKKGEKGWTLAGLKRRTLQGRKVMNENN